jgi:hypothetical protein
MRLLALIAGCGLAAILPSNAAACWNQAAQRYGLAPELLVAVARAESGLNPVAINRSHFQRTGTWDIGLMQINSSHLAQLARIGIGHSQLLDPCTNIEVGAWLLAESMARHGANWDAVGAYNAACTRLQPADCAAARSRYAWTVYRQLPARGIADAAYVSAATPAATSNSTSAPEAARLPVDHDMKATGACPAFSVAQVTP